ncbi:phosphotransferase [Micromonospora sp. PPF5-17]|uniref:Kinase n=1 Tax=Micromonospora solifontis TaxID=2487138 RepID=A0ABX9WCC1_9ACTN|nr:phosphotransferase [Micromonospora sp. PPF5-17B]NES38312.1 phosphotransferase [Micromonospora solifontis]NES54963.1 phosphotransferase [Micromonospora sp. PPF5-6]RNL96348.1 kinase [Micromonospora solifontis]
MRVGDTVRRPAGPWTDAVDALLAHLHAVGFAGAPRPFGRDERGRQVLEYVPGELGDPRGTYTRAELASIGAFLADLHRATATFVPPPGAVWQRVIPPDGEELICHHDAAPWNLVRSARGWVLIDWDGAGPGTRGWELAYAAQSMAGLRPDRPLDESAARLRVFVDGYGLPAADRPALAALLGPRARAMSDLLRRGARDGVQPWARIHAQDGPYWRAIADLLDAQVDRWTAALA